MWVLHVSKSLYCKKPCSTDLKWRHHHLWKIYPQTLYMGSYGQDRSCKGFGSIHHIHEPNRISKKKPCKRMMKNKTHKNNMMQSIIKRIDLKWLWKSAATGVSGQASSRKAIAICGNHAHKSKDIVSWMSLFIFLFVQDIQSISIQCIPHDLNVL